LSVLSVLLRIWTALWFRQYLLWHSCFVWLNSYFVVFTRCLHSLSLACLSWFFFSVAPSFLSF
jgi:hypothetical protein